MFMHAYECASMCCIVIKTNVCVHFILDQTNQLTVFNNGESVGCWLDVEEKDSGFEAVVETTISVNKLADSSFGGGEENKSSLS